MNYSKQLGMIADFIKPFVKDLKQGETVSVKISDYVTLSISGGFGGDIRISDCNPRYSKHQIYNEYTKWSSQNRKVKGYEDGQCSEYFSHFRKVPEHIARPLILNWKEIKSYFLEKYETHMNENKQIEEFEI
jgi:hypothetical protein